ncbi:MAG TPA: carbon-nitrogen hydrolase family protein [Burkholderiaceae bacterium]|nr:carbon-nitrogen hydrolase family protein [Burkholderiaceae bacterium]
MSISKIAVIQRAPSYLHRDRTIDAAVAAVAEAAAADARLVVFPEAFVPGYPAWIWRLRPGTDGALSGRLHGLLLQNAICLDRGDLSPLLDAARAHAVTVICGVDERDENCGGGTLYNTVVLIGPQGTILNRHRKLMPTNPERMVWGLGDGSGLNVVGTPAGRVGTLICWENFMPLARYALYAQGIEIYVAPTYDNGEGWIGSLQHIAREGCCWVVGSGCALRAADFAADFPERGLLYPDPDEWVNPGDSVIVAPGGKIVAGPMHRSVGILYADIDTERVGIARRSLDVVGHYARPDVFCLTVDTRQRRPVRFKAQEEGR